MRGSVVIPAFNEAHGVSEALVAIDEVLTKCPELEWELVVVDDGSTDHTSEQVKTVTPGLNHPLLLHKHPTNRGLGAALRTGFTATTGDVVIVMDSDLTYPAEATITALLSQWLQKRSHVVIASPWARDGRVVGVPKMLAFRSRAANKILSMASQHDLHTVTGMVRAYDGDFIRQLPIKATGPDVNAEIIFKAEGLRAAITEVPAVLDWTGREERYTPSKLVNSNARWTTLKSLALAHLFRPYALPLMASGLSIMAMLFMLIAGKDTLATTALAAGVVAALLAVLMFQSKRQFEELMFSQHAASTHKVEWDSSCPHCRDEVSKS